MDTTGDLFSEYGISSFPTTFMIDREGNVFGYVSGALNEDMMKISLSRRWRENANRKIECANVVTFYFYIRYTSKRNASTEQITWMIINRITTCVSDQL